MYPMPGFTNPHSTLYPFSQTNPFTLQRSLLLQYYNTQADNPERANSCTSAFYEGQAAIMDPRESWAAKWIRVDNCLPGVYAIAITGQFDRDIEEDLENRGIRWRCKPPGSTTE